MSKQLEHCKHIDFSPCMPNKLPKKSKPPVCGRGYEWSKGCMRGNACLDYEPSVCLTLEEVKAKYGLEAEMSKMLLTPENSYRQQLLQVRQLPRELLESLDWTLSPLVKQADAFDEGAKAAVRRVVDWLEQKVTPLVSSQSNEWLTIYREGYLLRKADLQVLHQAAGKER